MSNDPRRVTIEDVALAAGVSRATAGRALGDYGYVRSEIRERVQKAADAIGYRPNGLARSMITGRTDTIGVVGADIENPFFASAMRGIGDVARREGFGAILTNSDEDVRIERDAVRLLLEKQVDGIIVAPADPSDTAHLAGVVASGTPLVLLDRTVPGLDVDAVVSDGVDASRRAVQHLIDLGHRRIAMIAELRGSVDADWASWVGSPVRPSVELLMPSGARLLGYVLAHEEAGLPIDLSLIRATRSYNRDGAREQTLAALSLAAPPTAIFTADSVMTTGALAAIRLKGIEMPRDLSFLAFDDMEWFSFVTPAISAISQPVYDMGMMAAEMLIARMRAPGTKPMRRVIKFQMIMRESIRRI